MKVMLKSLPSNGFECPIDMVEIKPLTYRELRTYTSKHFDREIDKLIWDMECLIKPVDGWEDLNAFDLSTLIFTRKYISATFNSELKLELNKEVYKINMSDIHFKDLSDDIKNLDKIVLNGRVYGFKMPSMKQYYDILKYVSQDVINLGNDIDIDLLYLSSCLMDITVTNAVKKSDIKSTVDRLNSNKLKLTDNIKNVYNELGNVTLGDIELVNRLLHLLCDKTNDVTIHLTEGGATAVKIDHLIADIFRLISINNEISSSQVINKQEI